MQTSPTTFTPFDEIVNENHLEIKQTSSRTFFFFRVGAIVRPNNGATSVCVYKHLFHFNFELFYFSYNRTSLRISLTVQ